MSGSDGLSPDAFVPAFRARSAISRAADFRTADSCSTLTLATRRPLIVQLGSGPLLEGAQGLSGALAPRRATVDARSACEGAATRVPAEISPGNRPLQASRRRRRRGPRSGEGDSRGLGWSLRNGKTQLTVQQFNAAALVHPPDRIRLDHSLDGSDRRSSRRLATADRAPSVACAFRHLSSSASASSTRSK